MEGGLRCADHAPLDLPRLHDRPLAPSDEPGSVPEGTQPTTPGAITPEAASITGISGSTTMMKGETAVAAEQQFGPLAIGGLDGMAQGSQGVIAALSKDAGYAGFSAADEMTLCIWANCLYATSYGRSTSSLLNMPANVQPAPEVCLPAVLQDLRYATAIGLIRKPKEITHPMGHHEHAAIGSTLGGWLALIVPKAWNSLSGSVEEKLFLISDGQLVIGHDVNGQALVHLDPHALREAAVKVVLERVHALEQAADLQSGLDEADASSLIPAGLLDTSSPVRKPMLADGTQDAHGHYPGSSQTGVERSYTAPQPATQADEDHPAALRLSSILSPSPPARTYDPWRIASPPWLGLNEHPLCSRLGHARPSHPHAADQQQRSSHLRHALSFHPEILGQAAHQPLPPNLGGLASVGPQVQTPVHPYIATSRVFETDSWKVTLTLACLSMWWPSDPIMAGLTLAMVSMQPPADPRQQGHEARQCTVSVRCAAHELDRLRREMLHCDSQSVPGGAIYALHQLVSSQQVLMLHGDGEHGVVQLCYKAVLRHVLLSAGAITTPEEQHNGQNMAVWPPAVSISSLPPIQLFHQDTQELMRAVVAVLCMECGPQTRGWLLLAALGQMASMAGTPDVFAPPTVPPIDAIRMQTPAPAQPPAAQPIPLYRILQLAQVVYKLSQEGGDGMCESVLRCAAALHLAAAGVQPGDTYSAAISQPSTPVTRGTTEEGASMGHTQMGSEAGGGTGLPWADGDSSMTGNTMGIHGVCAAGGSNGCGGATYGVVGAGGSAGGMLSDQLASALARDQPAAWAAWRRQHPGTSSTQVHLLLYGVSGFVMVPSLNHTTGSPQQLVFLDVADLERSAMRIMQLGNGRAIQPAPGPMFQGEPSTTSSHTPPFTSPGPGMSHPHLPGHHPSLNAILPYGSQHTKVTRPVIVTAANQGTASQGSQRMFRYPGNGHGAGDPSIGTPPGSGGGAALTNVPPPPPPIGPPPIHSPLPLHHHYHATRSTSGEDLVLGMPSGGPHHLIVPPLPPTPGITKSMLSPEPTESTTGPVTASPTTTSPDGNAAAAGTRGVAWASAAATRAVVSSAPTGGPATGRPAGTAAKRPVRIEQLQRWSLAAFPGQSVAAKAQRAMVQALAEANDPCCPFNSFCRTATDLGQVLAERQPAVWAALTPLSGTKKYRLRPLIDSSPVFMRIKKPPSDCWIKLNVKELVAAASCAAARDVAHTATASATEEHAPQSSPSQHTS